jgi:hypothetical protein
MVYDGISNLKFDRRLLRRRGWIDAEELEKELADLPDVSDKAQPAAEKEIPKEPETSPERLGNLSD